MNYFLTPFINPKQNVRLQVTTLGSNMVQSIILNISEK